ncbi:hypothetical protein [Microtetraspora malaysiensis]|uniref:Uncharacterized protein n=1 Tax=Microtetraspora malaysiensis TaxID=161358 RepID=A0ABW6SYS7_9ACTN
MFSQNSAGQAGQSGGVGEDPDDVGSAFDLPVEPFQGVGRLSVDAFGHDPDEAYVEWCGGYLSPDTVIVTIAGETEDEQEWFHHYRVDARSGQVQAELDARGEHSYDIRPLGDGTWLTTHPSGHPVRWTDS